MLGNVFKILSDLMADEADFAAGVAAVKDMVASVKAGHMPSAADLQAAEKIVHDLAKIAAELGTP